MRFYNPKSTTFSSSMPTSLATTYFPCFNLLFLSLSCVLCILGNPSLPTQIPLIVVNSPRRPLHLYFLSGTAIDCSVISPSSPSHTPLPTIPKVPRTRYALLRIGVLPVRAAGDRAGKLVQFETGAFQRRWISSLYFPPVLWLSLVF
jgi:hypothetical protein